MDEKEFDTKQLQKFRNGDERAFETIFTLLSRPICEMAFKVTGSMADAEDICSETFIKLYEGREKLESFRHIKAFLYTVAKNLSLNYLRNIQIQHKNHKAISYLTGDPPGWEQAIEGEIIYQELIREIYSEINSLSNISTRYGQILEMTIFQKKKTEEIARLLGISESTVRNLKAKAIKSLQTAFLKKGLLSHALLIGLAFATLRAEKVVLLE